MQIPIVIEPVAGNGYRAATGAPLGLSAEGSTEKEAVDTLRQLLRQRLDEGARVETIDVPAAADSNPWVAFAGMFQNDQDFQEVVQIMAENRRQMDADPDIP